MRKVAVKRLAAVEISPDASHQHEFNAGLIREELGFGKGKTKGSLTVLVYTGSTNNPLVEDVGEYTLYDARSKHPTRSEYRLYYDSQVVSEYAKEGDLIAIYRPSSESTDLTAIISKHGAAAERQLELALLDKHVGDLRQFVISEPSRLGAEAARDLLPSSPPPPVVKGHPLFIRAIAAGSLPSTAELAFAGGEIANETAGMGDPDRYLGAALDAESDLFFAIERVLGERKLQASLKDGRVDFDRIIAITQSLFQSRRSRRGESLQNHFAAILTHEGVPFTAQCTTEAGEIPDFIIPSCGQYHDSEYPASKLRMVGCKTVVRERWRQWLNEAARIEIKYGLTVDAQLTADLVSTAWPGVRFFLPKEIIGRAYKTFSETRKLGSVADLLGELKATL